MRGVEEDAGYLQARRWLCDLKGDIKLMITGTMDAQGRSYCRIFEPVYIFSVIGINCFV